MMKSMTMALQALRLFSPGFAISGFLALAEGHPGVPSQYSFVPPFCTIASESLRGQLIWKNQSSSLDEYAKIFRMG
jgi:hypothetical protein